MHKEFPLSDVKIVRSGSVSKVSRPEYVSENLQVSQDEFFMLAAGVGAFYAREGKEVEYCPEAGADEGWVRLFLNGQVLVALLHQRSIINFHASSFIYDGMGVMVLGETGAGKTSVTASFVMDGAGFLTDDLSPVIFRESQPKIMALERDIKLRINTIDQLNIDPGRLRDAEQGTGKKYFKIRDPKVSDHSLHTIFRIETGLVSEPEFHEPSAAEKFSILRSEICSWEILAGMPETEKAYLHQLLEIIKMVKIVRVIRPAEIMISDLQRAIERFLVTV